MSQDFKEIKQMGIYLMKMITYMLLYLYENFISYTGMFLSRFPMCQRTCKFFFDDMGNVPIFCSSSLDTMLNVTVQKHPERKPRDSHTSQNW